MLSGLIFVTAVVLLSAAGIFAVVHLKRSNENFTEKYDIERNISPLESSAKSIYLLEIQSIVEPSEDKASLIAKQINDVYGEWDSAASTLLSSVGDVRQQSRLSELRTLISKRKELSTQVLKAALDADTEEAFALLSSDESPARGLNESIQKTTGDIIQTERSAASQLARDSSTQGRLWIYWLTLLSATVLASAVLLTQTLIVSLRKNLGRTSEGLLESADELVKKVQSAAQDGNKLSEKAATEAAAFEEMSTTVTQMISAVNAAAENTKLFTEFALEVSSNAEKGQAVGERLEQTAAAVSKNTDDIVKQTNDNKRQLEEFVKFFAEFSEKSKALNEFVFKAKLMAFNASLEAARAGESGRGFSLIADELAELAETSGTAARELSSMLNGRVELTTTFVRESCRALEEIATNCAQSGNEANSTVVECNRLLRELKEDSQRVAQFVQELRQASEAQALGFTELGKTICELEEMSRQNATVSETCAASADELAVRIIDHKALVKNLSLLINGQQASTLRTESQPINMDAPPQSAQNGENLKNNESILLTFRGKNTRKEKKQIRAQRFGQRTRSEEYMRKAAGAEDIPFEKE
jgi:methyl-accepting chemotaxis protein